MEIGDVLRFACTVLVPDYLPVQYLLLCYYLVLQTKYKRLRYCFVSEWQSGMVRPDRPRVACMSYSELLRMVDSIGILFV